MTIEQRFTDLPTVTNAQMTDIICAVQGYVSPSNIGLSVQETLQQVFGLFQNNIILFYPGNPNGFVAGSTYQFCWDTTDQLLWICTTTGTASTAVWTLVSTIPLGWVNVTTASQIMAPETGYVANNGALVTLTLPVTAAFGTEISIQGFGAGGWVIAQNAGQSIHVGSSVTTVGAGGSLASTNRYDSINLLCVVANTTWTAIGAPQSAGLTII